MERIYFDNAATSPLDPEVVDVMTKVMKEDFGNPSSIHHYGRKARSIIEDARKTVANLLKASIGEIFFVSTGTEAINLILKNSVLYTGIDHIITTPIEHHCVLHPLLFLEKHHRVNITYLNVDNRGNIDLEQLSDILKDTSTKKMLSVMHGNNEIGTMNDIHHLGEMCKTSDTLFHCDTVQTMGKYEIDVDRTYISFLSGSAHKFHGPKGAGFFYMNNDNIIPPELLGGAQERNMRAGTENIYGIVGLAKAMEVAARDQEQNIQHIEKLRSHFKTRLTTELEDIRFNGNQQELYMHHVLSVSFPPSPKADMLMFNLDISGICASSGSACSSGIEYDSHVLVATGHPKDRKTIRFSFSKFNTLEEVDSVIEKLKTITPVAV